MKHIISYLLEVMGDACHDLVMLFYNLSDKVEPWTEKMNDELDKVLDDTEKGVMTKTIQITVERDDDGTYIVSDDTFLVYGNDDSRLGALSDYASSLKEYFFLVMRTKENDPTPEDET